MDKPLLGYCFDLVGMVSALNSNPLNPKPLNPKWVVGILAGFTRSGMSFWVLRFIKKFCVGLLGFRKFKVCLF